MNQNLENRVKKISREEADKIIIDWKNGNNPHKRIVCAWKGQWYDLRELTEKEIDVFTARLTGIVPTKENTLNININ